MRHRTLAVAARLSAALKGSVVTLITCSRFFAYLIRLKVTCWNAPTCSLLSLLAALQPSAFRLSLYCHEPYKTSCDRSMNPSRTRLPYLHILCTLTNEPMQGNSHKHHYGTHFLSVRINHSAYSSLHRLIANACYKDTATFVRDAVRAKYKEIPECTNSFKAI